MLQRVSSMQTELDSLVESLRTGANRVSADLALLEGNMAELYTAAGARTEEPPEPAIEEAPVPPPPIAEAEPLIEPEPSLDAEPEALRAVETPEELAEPEAVELEPEPAAAVEPEVQVEYEAVEAVVEDSDADVEGARLIALNMALNGQSRDETDRYLAENFDLPDRQRLLDEVYSSVEG